MAQITVYEKESCSKCLGVEQVLSDLGISFSRVNFHKDPMAPEKLISLAKKIGTPLESLLRKDEDLHETLNVSEITNTGELARVMVSNPDLIQRPIIEADSKAVIGRPPDRVREIIN